MTHLKKLYTVKQRVIKKLLLVFALLPVCCFSQNGEILTNEPDTLEKYSYLLVGVKSINNTPLVYGIGTCFFIRNGKNLFLLTAKSNITGFSAFNLKTTSIAQFDTIGIRYYNTVTHKFFYKSLNIKPIRKYLSVDYFYDSPDLVILEFLDILVAPFINSLENDMFDDKQDDEILDSVISIGFALKEPRNFSFTMLPAYYNGVLADTSYINRFYPVNDSIYYQIQPKVIRGMEGSPVFLKYRSIKNKKEHFLFAGVLFGSDWIHNLAYAVNGQLVKRKVIEFVSLHK